MMLVQSPVRFHEESHKYFLNDKELSGITTIIKHYLFPDMYSNVSESVLEAARERGTAVHNELELEFIGIESDSAEAIAYRKIAKDNKFKQIAAEYLVHDELYGVATKIDSVLKLKGNNVALLDYKTTATLNTEYLRWQLSIEKMLFEYLNHNISVDKLYALHLPKPKDGVCDAKLVEIEPIPVPYIAELLLSYRDGRGAFENPFNNMGEEFDSLMEEYIQAEEALADIKERFKDFTEDQNKIKEKIRALMEEKGCTAVEKEGFKITRSANQISRTFDIELLKKQCPQFPIKWMKEIESKGYQESMKKGRLTIKIK